MFNSKKFFTLCATSIAGFSAVASIAPVSVFADAAKNGDTVVTYDGTPQPAEWGLSVPATVKLDASGEVISVANRQNYPVTYGTGQVKIIQEDGSDYPTGKSFTVDAQATRLATADGSSVNLYALKHGTSEPADHLGNIDNAWLTGGNSGSLEFDANSRSNWVSFSVKDRDLTSQQLINQKLNSTISWTATEKTS
ncbi:hypothetical protein [Lactococcus taiwanensis]|uniref:hypothetical protein n=1 Tax=Lactococcus taiwanensis TaxID=1151742 RepID=UPI0035171048